MPSRRTFLKQAGWLAGSAALAGPLSNFLAGCAPLTKWHFDISLAQWSLHKAFFAGTIKPEDFPVVAKQTYDIHAIEYVNQFYEGKAEDWAFLKTLKQRCDDQAVKSLLIMIDNEGSLSDLDPMAQLKAVDNHKKWVTMGAHLGCHSIRVNLHGHGDEKAWVDASVEGLGQLAEFCGQHEMNVIVENHGQYSSKGALLVQVMEQVNSPHCGTLPDFGNFCVERRDGDLWASPCIDEYDRYLGVEEMLPYAKGVSAKSHAFDQQGNETSTDFLKMLTLVKQSGYQGHIGVEFEGEGMSEPDGIHATKALLERLRDELG